MEKIKVAFFISNLGQGGAEKQFVTLIKELDSSKFEKHLFLYAYQKETFYNEIFGLSDVKVYTNKLKQTFPLFKILEAGFYLRRNIKKGQFDIVCSTLFMNNLFVRLFAPKQFKKKCIANVRTSFRLYNRYLLLLEKLQIKNSNLVFNSKKALEDFKNIIPSKYHNQMHSIYNGFEVPSDFISNNKYTFGCLGRTNVEKNFLQAISVFNSIQNQISSSNLILQGSKGNQHNQIQQVVTTSSKITIKDANPDVDIFFSEIKILIVPSLLEGCPNVLFEGLLRKKMCIISQGANTDNFIVNLENGLVYDGSDEGLEIAMKKAIDIIDTEDGNNIIAAGYKYAKDNFSVNSMINKYQELFLKIYEKN